MISVWPNMNRGTDDNEEMAKAGKLLCNYSTYDAFDPEARDLYWKQAERELFAAGTDAWWCDSTEPFTPGLGRRESVQMKNGSRWQKNRPTATWMPDIPTALHWNMPKAFMSIRERLMILKRVVNLTRSGSLAFPALRNHSLVRRHCSNLGCIESPDCRRTKHGYVRYSVLDTGCRCVLYRYPA